MNKLFNTIADAAAATATVATETAAAATEAVVETVQAAKSVGIFGKIKEHGVLIGGVAGGVAAGYVGYKLGKKYIKHRAAKKAEASKADAK
jgi:hypothetical protein